MENRKPVGILVIRLGPIVLRVRTKRSLCFGQTLTDDGQSSTLFGTSCALQLFCVAFRLDQQPFIGPVPTEQANRVPLLKVTGLRPPLRPVAPGGMIRRQKIHPFEFCTAVVFLRCDSTRKAEITPLDACAAGHGQHAVGKILPVPAEESQKMPFTAVAEVNSTHTR